jgi:hypothetical protein
LFIRRTRRRWLRVVNMRIDTRHDMDIDEQTNKGRKCTYRLSSIQRLGDVIVRCFVLEETATIAMKL